VAGQRQFNLNDALDASGEVFWRRGYEGTSIQHLVEATGVNRGSLYGTFGNKQGLFLAALDRYAQTVSGCLFDALAEHPDDHLAAIRALLDAIVTRFETSGQVAGCLIANSAAECFALHPDIQTAVRRMLDEQVAAVQAVLKAARERGDLPENAVEQELALFVVATAQALAVMHRAGTTPAMLRTVAATAVSAFDNGATPYAAAT